MAAKDQKRKEQEDAWIGDCVLELYARTWILKNHGTLSGEMVMRMTSNQFLATIGNPTAVEASIGRLYETDGMDAAFAHIEKTLMPLFLKQEKKRK